MDISWITRKTLPEGTVRRILSGPCRGFSYKVRSGFGYPFLLGMWERSAFRVAREYMRPGGVVFDVGANIGAYTMLASRCVGRSGLVVAFEPAPVAFDDLKFNVELNGLANVRCNPWAVSSQPGMASFDPSGPTTGKIAAQGSVSVQTVSLDCLDEPAPDFIKIDVEGHESQVLMGATKTLERSRPTLLISLHTPEEDRAVGRILVDLRYRAFRLSKEPVKNMLSGYPDPDGMRGVVLALPLDRSNCP